MVAPPSPPKNFEEEEGRRGGRRRRDEGEEEGEPVVQPNPGFATGYDWKYGKCMILL
jgi:hypothetical protein